MTDIASQADSDLVSAVESYFESLGWATPDMPITDVVVLAVRRGFDLEGGKANSVCIVPTETPVPMVLGMVRYAQEWCLNIVRESFSGGGF
jgi:hypothetical protein